MSFPRLLLMVISLVGCRSIPDPAADRPRRLVLLYTGDLHGVTEPCGCTADILLGGIDRLGRKVAAERAQAGDRVLLVDAGNVLAAGPRIEAQRRAQEDARADVISEAFVHMRYDAVAVGPYDLAFGIDGLRTAQGEARLPWLSSNLRAPDAPWRSWRLVEAGGLRVAVVGLTDPELVPKTPGLVVLPMMEGLGAALAEIRPQRPDLVVGIGAVHRRRLRRLLKETPGIDVFVRSHRTQRDDTPRRAGSGWIVEPHEEAQSLGRVRVGLGPTPGPLTPAGLSVSERERLTRRRAFLAKAGRAEALAEVEAELRAPAMSATAVPSPGAFAVELLPVTPDLRPIPALEELRNEFNRRLKDINLARTTPPPPLEEGASGYAGVEECAMCHDEEEAFWKTTEHARAVATLVERDKQFDEECISCHVTGYRQPGGSSLGHLGVLEEVQCESCHGPSSLHAEDGQRASAPPAKVPESVCVVCHNAKHSPKFDYAAWTARIVGPGHGLPAP